MLSHFLMICALAYPLITDRTLALHADAAGMWSTKNARFGCAQPVADQAAIIREAEANDFTIRRLEFVGNERISDWVLRRRMSTLQEGERFSRSNLERSLANVSRLRIIYPVRFSDVVLRLEKSEKLVDMVICFKEKKVAKK
jgi:outer membrane protein assembly factor BamA